MTATGVPVSDQPFTRTGLLGFVGPVSVNEQFWPHFFLTPTSE